MKFAELGNRTTKKLRISKICLGSNNFGAQVSAEDSKKILDTAYDCGVNLVDTADMYTQGKSERIIGEWAKGRRNDIQIATKVGMVPGASELSNANIRRQLEASLERLETDYIDLYYAHQFDERTPLIETLKTFDSLVRENKVRHVACSNFSARQLADALSISRKEGFVEFIANQVRYNILQRDEIETEILPFCLKEHVGVFAYSPLRSGLLAGRYESKNATPPSGSRAAVRGPEYFSQFGTEENFRRLSNLKSIASELDLSLAVLSIAWILSQNGMSSAVVGSSNPEQFVQTSKASEVELPKETVERINSV